MTIRPAIFSDIPYIRQLAHDTWWPAYGDILSKEQISFMLEDMYSEDALEKQMYDGTTFLVAENGQHVVAFASYTPCETGDPVVKVHKLYILPSEQGKGTGKNLITHIEELCRNTGGSAIELNVHRKNPAVEFYKKNGFHITREVNIPYHQYELTDYIMRKELISPEAAKASNAG